MFGEIRREDEARLLLRFARDEGKLLATVKAPSTAAALVDLVRLTEDAALVNNSVVCALGQRLIRTLCTGCREPVQPDPAYLQRLGMDPSQPGTWFRANGCHECLDSGYSGRTAIYSMLIVTDPVKAALAEPGATAGTVRHAAGQVALRTLQQDGLTKVAAGLTTFDEVCRATTGDDKAMSQKEERG